MLRSLTLLLILLSFYGKAVDKNVLNLANSPTSPTNKTTTSFINNDVSIYKQSKPVSSNKTTPLNDSSYTQFSVSEIRKNNAIRNIFDPIDKQEFDNIVGGSAGVTLGRFSAETGIIEHEEELTNNKQYFLQGTYVVVQKERLSIAFLAKIEAFERQKNQFHSYHDLLQLEPPTSSKSTNATLGLIGSYSLSPQWAIVGAITSTQADNIAPVAFADEDTNHSALLGTTYSF